MWGVRGGRERPPLTHIQSNACRFLFLLFIYLRFAEAASFDKKSYAGAIHTDSCQLAESEVMAARYFLINRYFNLEQNSFLKILGNLMLHSPYQILYICTTLTFCEGFPALWFLITCGSADRHSCSLHSQANNYNIGIL
jgi:hypothetical protein